MAKLARWGDRIGWFLLPVLLLLGILYFAYHAFDGRYGWFAYLKTQDESAILKTKIAALERDEARLKRLSAGLRTESLDLDLLDERMRVMFGYVRADEVIVLPE